MLVINRKLDEKVNIGNNIVVTILSIQGNRVKLGFECPRDIDVYRPETREKREHAEKEEQT